MWCVASAPIVPLARDLDASLGMPRGELAAHFRKLSTPLPTTPLPSRAAPAFFPQGALPLLTTPLPSRAAPAFFPQGALPLLTTPLPSRAAPAFLPHTVRAAPTLAGSLLAFPHLRHVPPRSTPLPPHGHRCNGTFLPKTQKNEHRSLGSGARFGLLSGRHSAEWC